MEPAQEQAPLLSAPPPPPPPPPPAIPAEALAPPHAARGTLPLALQQSHSCQLAALSLALLLALQTAAPVAGAWSALAVSLLSAFLSLTTHAAAGGHQGPQRARDRDRPPPPHHRHVASTGPSALASLALDAAVAIAAASWLAAWAWWPRPPGPSFWLRWQPTLVLGLLALELLVAGLAAYPPARALLADKSPPLLLTMDLPARPVAGSPASPAWLSRLARDVTLAWGGMAALACGACAIPAAADRHAFFPGGGGGAEAAVDGLDVALSVVAPFALLLAAGAITDALCERARRQHLPRMMAAVAAASGAAAAPPSGPPGLV
jgi:hypothetical protein